MQLRRASRQCPCIPMPSGDRSGRQGRHYSLSAQSALAVIQDPRDKYVHFAPCPSR
jgi:hypothetical protein